MNGLRLPYFKLSPEPLNGFRAIKTALESSELGEQLVELVYLRVSQMNGCAYCLKLHSTSLGKMGESADRLAELAGWRVSDQFDAREKAALAWCEAITDIGETHDIPDEIFEPLKAHFSDKEISDLTFAAALMNGMNRLAIPMRQ